MIGIGTVINSVSIIAGGFVGHFAVKAVLDFIFDWVSTDFSCGDKFDFWKKLNVANMLPAVLLAVLAAYLPWNF